MRKLFENLGNLVLSLFEGLKKVAKIAFLFALGLILFIVLPVKALAVAVIVLALALIIFTTIYIVENEFRNKEE